MKTFEVKDRQIEIDENNELITLSSDGSLDFRIIKQFENEFNCDFQSIMPFIKYGGASWISFLFVKRNGEKTKTYNYKTVEKLLEEEGARTLKTECRNFKTVYLDVVKNGSEFLVNLDEFNKGVYTNIIDADLRYYQILSDLK